MVIPLQANILALLSVCLYAEFIFLKMGVE